MVLISEVFRMIQTRIIDGFRPLAGIMVLIMKRTEMYKALDGKKVSVPLRGLWFLSVISLSTIVTSVKRFPSPCGDYGSYRAYLDYLDAKAQYIVSVPLRGLWFLSAPFINAFMKPSKWHFAGRIIYFHHFLSFAGK